ncbi:alkaline phosphatase family protein [Microbulbifer sp. OS29]|uniref:Alkaline phosphatase family protein n=1 Tax=Microbulbifer okhotskensis TaxID=2926617 RepID=A0A9X2J6Y4_9GAMM|nr:alkaline phosphatase family protein [Microbulbifer okhotskensis]MCO1335145.1 alkaline phosphatase family protein [Microbulbifer okhotskensis]
MKSLITTVLALLLSTQAYSADNLILVTIDGLRWQEVFSGYDTALLNHEEFTDNKEILIDNFHGNTPEEKRQKLMPFIWQTVANKGTLIGNREKGSEARVTNNWWFSYPGYNEILTGSADPKINSNNPVPNANTTFLEWLINKPEFKGSVAAFGSWGAFASIINRERSGVYVNAGLEPASWPKLTQRAKFLNDLQGQLPVFWEDVRPDAFTYGFAKEYLISKKPRVMYIALGETDDFAHDQEYHQYLHSAHRSDMILASLWQTLQSLEHYRDNTNLIITVDHGRGNTVESWPHHASGPALAQYFGKEDHPHPQGVPGSDEIWIAALGPDIKASGEVSGGDTILQDQVAATALKLLNYKPKAFSKESGPAIDSIVKQ